MKAYRLNLGVVVSVVAIFTLLIFSLVLFVFKIARTGDILRMVTSYGYLIAPAGMLWVLTNNYLWHTKFFQVLRRFANIPPDLRGRWEGELRNPENESTQKFVIEIKQTLTALSVFSYSSLGRSVSILPEIARAENEGTYSLCFLWQGETHQPMKQAHYKLQYNGYTILTLDEHDRPKTLDGVYFTNHKPKQTRGTIQLIWASKRLKKGLE